MKAKKNPFLASTLAAVALSTTATPLAALSWGTDSVPSGIVFNYSGVPGQIYGTIWYAEWQ
ncbi:hypothetical protein [Oenococcus sicerae]|uniref:hypothetical protein n=1 Tax=Oenococcus sicerae TaxID=2203724 RepID=UPI0010BBC3E6|nr:hypothetical protein OAL24_01300 [Oenococcus sicerae]